MQTRCSWEEVSVPRSCAVEDCYREARFLCQQHPGEGLFCNKHRWRHSRSVAKTGAELDSRPREEALVPEPTESLEKLLTPVNGSQIREGSPNV